MSAKMYAASDPATIESIKIILEDADIRESVVKKRDEKEKVRRNQKVGKAVEDLLKAELNQAEIKVERTGIGSDYEVESDFVENREEQILKVGSYLLEVKSTSGDYVRMTLRQGEEAVKEENIDRYILCVVEVPDSEPDAETVRTNAKFVLGVGDLLQDKVKDAKNLKDMEEGLSPSGAEEVEIQLEGSKIRFKLNRSVWSEQGIPFNEFVEKIRNGSLQ